jgi:signal transduction histidine kinase
MIALKPASDSRRFHITLSDNGIGFETQSQEQIVEGF